MDAEVITMEATRSKMELLDAFADFEYPNEIGPGVYDIHSPPTFPPPRKWPPCWNWPPWRVRERRYQ
ncbi:MAG: hypothetical protein ACPW60_03820 [Methylohalobius sp. ZOD2]